MSPSLDKKAPFEGCCLFASSTKNVIVSASQDLFEPQTGLLRYVLEQPYSREMVCNMLGLNKQVLPSSLYPFLPLSLPSHLSSLLSLWLVKLLNGRPTEGTVKGRWYSPLL